MFFSLPASVAECGGGAMPLWRGLAGRASRRRRCASTGTTYCGSTNAAAATTSAAGALAPAVDAALVSAFGARVALLPHQRSALAWMLDRERHAVGGEYGAGWKEVGRGKLVTKFYPEGANLLSADFQVRWVGYPAVPAPL